MAKLSMHFKTNKKKQNSFGLNYVFSSAFSKKKKNTANDRFLFYQTESNRNKYGSKQEKNTYIPNTYLLYMNGLCLSYLLCIVYKMSKSLNIIIRNTNRIVYVHS